MERNSFPASSLPSKGRPGSRFGHIRASPNAALPPVRGGDGEGNLTLVYTHIPRLSSHRSKLIWLLVLQRFSSFLHSVLKLITVMFPLSEKKINFHCHPDLANNAAQVRRKWEIITQRTRSLLFVRTLCHAGSEDEGEEVRGNLEVCLTFSEILKNALKRQMAIDCSLIAEREGEEENAATNSLKKTTLVHSCALLKPSN